METLQDIKLFQGEKKNSSLSIEQNEMVVCFLMRVINNGNKHFYSVVGQQSTIHPLQWNKKVI